MPGRELTIKKYNLDLYDPFETDGPFEMPVIKKTLHIPNELIGFNEAISSKNYQSGIHMFIDDYQFERIWNAPKRYVNVLKQYDCVLTPDFSLYMDMPRAMKVWNIYRSRSIVGKRSWLTKKRMERALRQIFNFKIMKGGILWLS